MHCAIVWPLVTQPSWLRSCASIVRHAPPAPTQVNSLLRISFMRLTASAADDTFISESQCSTTWHHASSQRWQLNVPGQAAIITTTRIGRHRRGTYCCRALLVILHVLAHYECIGLRRGVRGETDGGCGESYFESVHVVNDAGEQLLDHRRTPAHFWRLWFGWSFFSWRWLFAGDTGIGSACNLET